MLKKHQYAYVNFSFIYKCIANMLKKYQYAYQIHIRGIIHNNGLHQLNVMHQSSLQSGRGGKIHYWTAYMFYVQFFFEY